MPREQEWSKRWVLCGSTQARYSCTGIVLKTLEYVACALVEGPMLSLSTNRSVPVRSAC